MWLSNLAENAVLFALASGDGQRGADAPLLRRLLLRPSVGGLGGRGHLRIFRSRKPVHEVGPFLNLLQSRRLRGLPGG